MFQEISRDRNGSEINKILQKKYYLNIFFEREHSAYIESNKPYGTYQGYQFERNNSNKAEQKLGSNPPLNLHDI